MSDIDQVVSTSLPDSMQEQLKRQLQLVERMTTEVGQTVKGSHVSSINASHPFNMSVYVSTCMNMSTRLGGETVASVHGNNPMKYIRLQQGNVCKLRSCRGH